MDGLDVTGPIDLPDTGGWQTWQTITRPGVTLSAGPHVVRVVLASNGTSGGAGNYNWFRFVAPEPVPAPSLAFGGVPVALPGVVQAENFDTGGQGTSYSDTTARNSGSVYRDTAVDIGATGDSSNGGYYVGWTRSGEWLAYTVEVAEAREYLLNVRVANLGTGARFRIEVDGVDRTGPITLPDTGGWDAWQTVSAGSIPLTRGRHIVALVMLTPNSENAGVGNFGYLSFR